MERPPGEAVVGARSAGDESVQRLPALIAPTAGSHKTDRMLSATAQRTFVAQSHADE